MGGILSASAASALMSGCKPSGAGLDLDWQPEFLTRLQGANVREFAERIMPTTDTPGAKEANVQEFIDLYLRDIYTEEEQKAVTAGLDELEAAAQDAHGMSFAQLTPEQMDALMTEFAQSAVSEDKSVMEMRLPGGKPNWFASLKEMTLVGFFSSEAGATQVLQYEPVPGAYLGCEPLEEIGPTWATT